MISQKEYQQRRRSLAQLLPADSVALISAASETLRNGDANYRFRQDSNFYYLTGFSEPDAMLVVMGGKLDEAYLFNQPKNPLKEQWTGQILGQEAAKDLFKLTDAFPIENLSMKLPELLSGKSAIYYPFNNASTQKLAHQSVFKLKEQIRRGIKAPNLFCDLDPIVSEQRLFKSEAEIALMQKAADISVLAHKRAMQLCTQKTYEYELEAELIYEFYRHGCRAVAYDSIVAGGNAACILHYTDNNQVLNKGDLVLIDAGGEYENYASDITRTFPISGKFSDAQRALYQLVLKAQQAGIACIKPGIPWTDIQTIIVKVLTEGLCELGILKGKVEDLITNKAYTAFYMHNSGHWLGLDVHDVGSYRANSEPRPLQEGMVLTVEPGLYISESSPKVASRWLGLGIRIEDDILVTRDGYRVLTKNLPVEIDEIEALMGA